MAMMLGKLYQALRDAGVSDDRALAAAEEVAGFDNALDAVRGEMVALRSELRGEVAGLRIEVRVVQAVGGVGILLMAAMLWQLVALRGEVADVRAAVGSVDARVGRLETRMDAFEARLGRVDGRLDGIERRPSTP
jgi:hypothetical protein